jgi:MYXO-CTERM domain-containing protein
MIKKLTLALLVSGLATAVSMAATPGTDNANDPAYNSGWNNGTDGGTPATFSAWQLVATPTGTGTAGFFIGDSTTLGGGNSGGNVNVNNKAFGMFAHSGSNADATRSFDSPLAAGQTFSIDIAVNFRNGNKGFDLLSGTTSIFNLNVGGDAYMVNNAATGNGTLFGSAYDANTVFHISLTQDSLSGGSWTVTRSGGMTGTASGTYSGDGSGFHLYNSQTTGGGAAEDNLFANNLSVTSAVPEPTTLSLLAGPALLGGLFFIRRRRA